MWNRCAAAAFAAGILIVAGAWAHAAARATARRRAAASIAPWGIDLGARDLAVRPGDDFYRYAGGHWLDSNQIPARPLALGLLRRARRARAAAGARHRAGPAGRAPAGSNEQKVGDYYRAFMDTSAIDQRGIEPARAAIDAITQARRLPRPDAPHGPAGPGPQGAAADRHLDRPEEPGPLRRDHHAKRPGHAGPRLLPQGRPGVRGACAPSTSPTSPACSPSSASSSRRPRRRRSSMSRRRSPSCTGRRPSAASATSPTTRARAWSLRRWRRDSSGRRCSPPRESMRSRSSSSARPTRCRHWRSCSCRCRWRPGAPTSSTTTW